MIVVTLFSSVGFVVFLCLMHRFKVCRESGCGRFLAVRAIRYRAFSLKPALRH